MTPHAFVADLAIRMRTSIPVGALIYLGSDQKAQDALRDFGRVAEEGLEAISLGKETSLRLIEKLKTAKTSTIWALSLHQKSIEAAMAEALRSIEEEARRLEASLHA